MTEEKNKPQELPKLGRIRTKVWANDAGDGSIRYSVDVYRTYKTKDGFKDTANFGEEDLAIVQIAYQKAADYIAEQKRLRK